MAFISKRAIPSHIKRDMSAKAGFREKQNMQGSSCVVVSSDGDRVKFVRKNPNYGKKGETTKTYHSTYSLKRRNWIG